MLRKFTAMLCALLILAGLMTACSTPGDGGDETTAALQTTGEGGVTAAPGGEDTAAPGTDPADTGRYDDNGYVLDDLPELNYENAAINILTWKCYYGEWSEEETGEVIDNSLWLRDLNVEERLKIELNVEQIDGSNHYRTEFLKKVSTLVAGGDTTYDLIAQYCWVSGNASLQGLYQDISDTDYVDFDKPWWPRDMVQSTMIHDKVYFVTGDIAPSMIYSTFVTVFNEKLITDYGLESPYTLVENGKWTLDKLIEMASPHFLDNDSSGTATQGDLVGFAFWADTHTKAFMYGSGIRVIEVNSDGEYALSELYSGQKMQDLVEKLNNWIFDNTGILMADDIAGDGEMFRSGNALFGEYDLYYMSDYLPSSTVNYGVVPTPKYDEAQEDYYSFCGNGVTTYSIPTTVKTVDRSAAILEALASESYRTVTPAIFETALKDKYSPSPEAAAMLDLIHDTIVVDIAPYYTDNLLGYKEMRTILNSAKTGWVSQYAGLKTMLGKAVKNINNKLASLNN